MGLVDGGYLAGVDDLLGPGLNGAAFLRLRTLGKGISDGKAFIEGFVLSAHRP
jgi:hypothetical protein